MIMILCCLALGLTCDARADSPATSERDVRWKQSEPVDASPQPFNTLLDEAPTPLDRDVFRRELDYYRVITGENSKTTHEH